MKINTEKLTINLLKIIIVCLSALVVVSGASLIYAELTGKI